MEIKVSEALRLKVCKTLRQQSKTMSHSNSAGCLLNDVEKIKKNCARYFLNNCRENRAERSRNAYSTITARHLSDNCREGQIQKVGKCSLKNHKENQTLSEQNAQSSWRRFNTERAKCLLNNRREDEIGSARDINVTIAETNKPTVFLTPK